MTYEWFDISKIDLLPIRQVRFQQIGGGDSLTIRHLESESSWSAEPITVARDDGGTAVLGFNINMTLYVAQNNYIETLSELESLVCIDKPISSTSPVDVMRNPVVITLRLGGMGSEEQYVSGEAAINATGSMGIIFTGSLVYGIESVELRPRLKITARGTVRGNLTTTIYE